MNRYSQISNSVKKSLVQNILVVPGTVISGLSIYFTLSFFYVPQEIVIGLSIIIATLIFGITNSFENKRKNQTAIQSEKDHDKNPFCTILFIIIYIFTLAFTFIPEESQTVFILWEQFTSIQFIKLLSGIVISIFMPGYALLKIFDKESHLKGLSRFLVSYLISALITGLVGYFGSYLGLTLENINLTIIGVNGFILFLLLTTLDSIKSISIKSAFNLTSIKRIKYYTTEVLIFSSLFALVIFSTYYLYEGTIIGDQWFHHGKSLLFMSESIYDFATAEIDETYPPFFSSFLGTYITLTDLPSINAYVALNFLNFVPIIAFYYFLSRWFPNKKEFHLLATVLFTLSSGFGWIYMLSIVDDSFLISQKSALELIQASGLKTFDIWLPNTFVNTGHPDITGPLLIFGIPTGFIFLGLLKEKITENSKLFFLLVVIPILGYLAHEEFGLFIIMAAIIPLIFNLYNKNYVYFSTFSALFFVSLSDLFLPGQYYVSRLILGIPIVYFLLSFLSITWIIHSSNVLLITYNKFKNFNYPKITIDRKIKLVIVVVVIALFSYAYVLSFVIWDIQLDEFDLYKDTNNFKNIPWYFYPLRFGIAGLLGFAFILSVFFKKYEKSVIVFGFLGMFAFLLGPYYNEHRFNKYIMVSLASLASIFIFNLLTIQKPSFSRPIFNSMILGAVIVCSSFSLIFYLGYVAIGLDNPDFEKFNEDLPRRYFPLHLPMYDFLNNNMDLSVENIFIPTEETIRRSGVADSLQGFVGLPSTRITQNNELLESTSMVGFYYFIDRNSFSYLLIPKNNESRDRVMTTEFIKNNFKVAYENDQYYIYKVPFLTKTTSNNDISFLLPEKQIESYNSTTIFFDLNSRKIVNDASQTSIHKRENISTVTTYSFVNDVFQIENNFRLIEEKNSDNHSGIVWDDGNAENYILVRPTKLSAYNSIKGEFASAPIEKLDNSWHNLKIIFTEKTSKVFFDNKLKIEIINNPNEVASKFKVGIRNFERISEFGAIKIQQGSVSEIDTKYAYEYPISALALSQMQYNVLKTNDMSRFSSKNVIISYDPITDNYRYLDFVENGGTLAVLSSDGEFKGYFSKLLSLKLEKPVFFNEIRHDNTRISISGFVDNVYSLDPDVKIKSTYTKDGEFVAPFVIEKSYGQGKIIFVNSLGFFSAIEQSPQQYFDTLSNLISMLDLESELASKLKLKSQQPRFVGNMAGSGEITVTSNSLSLPINEFNVQMDKKYFSNSSIADLINEKSSDKIRIHNMEIFGPFKVVIKTSNISHSSLSEHGYTSLSFPSGFDMNIELSKNATASFFVEDNEKPFKINGGILTFEDISILLDDTRNILSMKNPIITIDGNIVFDQLHSINPHTSKYILSQGVPTAINGEISMIIEYNDNLGKEGSLVTYFDWLTFNANIESSEKSNEPFDINLDEIIDSEANFRIITIIILLMILPIFVVIRNG